MAMQSAYGAGLGERFRLETPGLVTRALHNAEMAVTHLRCDAENHGMTDPFPKEDAFLIALQIREVPEHELWVDDRPVRRKPFAAGATSFYDLKRNPIAYLRSPFHSLMFYFPRLSLNTIANVEGAEPIDNLNYQPGIGVDDPVMRGLAMALLPAFEHPGRVSHLVLDHLMMAVGAHIASTYGGLKMDRGPERGGLAPWQERRAKEILAANLDGRVAIGTLAAQCGLSVSHFSRAFRQTTGVAPHQWLVRQRVEAAKSLLRERNLTLSEVAMASGFADQSHLTRVFSGAVGASPGAWRRRYR